ncbi:isoleucyl-tRNA synthetase [Actinoplanes sp. SE50]|uniref:isoleucine--tRNA ligase n=1 Tax=unclassified Actinoplanes TaxID=2626549 RepID=UPI00023ED573|nr:MULTISPECIES: isoleucine--tRNA ligase [unclassified Actinoplanes]AEV82263.1 isoleucyl-tRNA synthetase [Actinoplanes sp. SE50/110]ATO80660.1 isoleucyl-tRNA synthetase [Actinoplanes sp. SE50]SLL98067.1 isoleucine--tRNA ligase [Actinoplanes sp. SE50/110]
MYPKHTDAQGVPASPDLPAVERAVLEHWAADKTFEASVEQRPAGENGANEYVFYDGPPFANGLPHYGHLFTGYVKDVVPRYRTMRGQRVERRFGWDTHGMPAEIEAEKQLGITSKAQIVELGIDKFNEACRTSVLAYTKDWQGYVTRQARWVDFGNDYKTLDPDYMESVMWAFKTLHDKGLVYEGFRVLAYCYRCETPLSNTETRMDDVYRDRTDPALTVKFRLSTGEDIAVWTTTPWTLPSNLALAVGPDIEYAVLADGAGQKLIVGAGRVAAYAKELDGYEQVGTVRGSELVGRRYTPLFDYLVEPAGENAFQVLGADFVTTEDGTGVVHMAPAFGEDDQNACLAAGIPTVVTVDEQTRFTSLVPDFQGLQVFDANKPVIATLKERGVVVRHDGYTHSYPHCWRCDTPLVYKAVSSWFVAVTRFRDRMVELNQEITWTPAHIKDGSFGKWLSNARDWSISRNRFWGSPIPVWKSDDPQYPRVDVYGSFEELSRDFGVAVTDLHRPGVDELTRPNPDDPTGRSTMRRVPEVLDCWFESGSMPFAQVHYPFENKEWFEHHYPGDFIVEYIGQTRGWFYTMHVLATALFDRPAFRNCLSHGILLGEDGRKMSKSLRNYPDVYRVFDSYGSDAMRWMLMSSPVLRGGDMPVTETAIRDSVRQVLLPLWNVWYFFSLYANAASHEAKFRTDSTHLLDRYILAKTGELVEDVAKKMDEYDISGAAAGVRSYLDALTNWYVRRSRDRFWAGDADAFDTLATVLEALCRVVAPLAPLTAEEVWRGLTGGRSVHLTDWPSADAFPADHELVASMDAIRDVASAALSLRKAKALRVRLPLATLTVAAAHGRSLESLGDLLKDEVNVKDVVFTDDVAAYCQQVLTVVPRALGPRVGKQVQQVIKAVKAGDWELIDGAPVAAGITLAEGEYELKLVAADAENSAPLPAGGGVVVLDAAVTPELAAEGLARDVIRVVQQARRDAGLDVSDRISLIVSASAAVRAAVETHREFVAGETLATSLTFDGVEGFDGEVGDGEQITVGVTAV